MGSAGFIMKETTWKSSVYSKPISVLLILVLLLVSLFLGGYHYYRKTPSPNTYDSVSLAALLSLPDLNLEPTQATINDLRASLSLNLSQVEYL